MTSENEQFRVKLKNRVGNLLGNRQETATFLSQLKADPAAAMRRLGGKDLEAAARARHHRKVCSLSNAKEEHLANLVS